jgi:hypothetical protein
MGFRNLFDCAEGSRLAGTRSTVNAENEIAAHQNFLHEPELFFVQSRSIPVLDRAGGARSNRLRLAPPCPDPFDGFALIFNQLGGRLPGGRRMRPDVHHWNEAALPTLPVQFRLNIW